MPGDLSQVVTFARSKMGDPYVWGATGPNSFDCSGLVYAAYKAAGFDVSRTTAANLGKMGKDVPAADAVPGDIVYFDEPGATDHVGIYIGNGQMIDAPHTGASVEIDNVHGFTSIRDLTADGSGGNGSIGQAAAQVAGQVASAANPFSGWQSDVLSIALKLAGAAACAALVIVGAKSTVKG